MYGMSESPKVNKKQVGVGLENNPEREEDSNNNNQEEEEEVSPKGKQRSYRGIRPRGYKWVSEIRELKKVTKIWLGTWPAAEKAAAAYDAAALALRGDEAVLNLPEDVYRYPRPSSSSHDDIKNAAAAAAAMRNDTPEAAATTAAIIDETQQAQAQAQEQAKAEAVVQEYIDVEAELNMPNLLFHMAGAMMLSPPPFLFSATTDSYVGEIGSLWSYK